MTLSDPLLPGTEKVPIKNVSSPADEQVEPAQVQDDPSAFDIETAIVFQLAAALVAKPPAEITVVGVQNKKGVVTLTGQVPSQAIRAQAEEIASVHPDVESAVNDLLIRPADDAASGDEGKAQETSDASEHPSS